MTAGAPERHGDMRRALAEEAAACRTLLAEPRPQIRFIADLACPWCYIAFTRLRHLLLVGGIATAELLWHPFLLNPHLPAEGVARAHYLERRFGSLSRAHNVHRRVSEVGAEEGIDFAFAGIQAQPNTIVAHALVLAAGAQGRLLDAAGAVFRAFFTEGADIGDPALLAGLARRLGLPEETWQQASEAAMLERVVAAHDQACGWGINGVPVFLFGRDHLIAGAQPTEALMALLDLERQRGGGAAQMPKARS